ncbi:MAG TPA: dimethyl sulfoxide reductase anchor subunit [Syntrophorhabdaceae bacterium]|nr:dimethyl sulfoxide reductase anchor subunit [Syntrophorhabdaceae bacterium]HPA07255.1 dimethyl sulfoxide reductase anchor subunit [Methanoregulaceae archaeon]
MGQDFIIDYRANEELDSLVALNLAFEGAGSALIMSSALLNYPRGIMAGLVLVAIGILFLFFHLGNRLRCWRVIIGLKNSWISKGALFAGGLLFFGALSLCPLGETLHYIVRAGTIVLAFLTVMYAGFFLSSMTPIPFWNTPLTPVLFFMHSATTGLSILMFMLALDAAWLAVDRIIGWVALLAGMALVFTLIHVMVMASSTNAARESVRMLLQDGLKLSFFGGVIMLGLVIPLVVSLYLTFINGLSAQNLIGILTITMVFRSIGDYAFRSSILNAGVYELMI